MIIDSLKDINIPVEIYHDKEQFNNFLPIVIIHHGYKVEHKEYSFIANHLTGLGYLVVSPKYEITETLKMNDDNLFERRKPLWKAASENILTVISDIKNTFPDINSNKVILIGHSFGGDVAMTFGSHHPELIEKIISLDSLRYPPPRNMPILIIKAFDTKADYDISDNSNIELEDLYDATHNSMSDRGPKEVKQKINAAIENFLRKYHEILSRKSN